MANTYFVCARTAPPIKFDIFNENPSEDAVIIYFIRAFQIIEQIYDFNDYVICFAWSSRIKLPCLGPNVISVIYGDEHCRVPGYVSSVAAVIKCHGFFPNYVPRLRPLRLAQTEMVEFLRNLILWLPMGWRWAFPAVRSRCHLVPVGYGFAPTAQPIPFDRRPYITSFQGSVSKGKSRFGLRNLIGTPKNTARVAAVRALRHLEKKYPPGSVCLFLTGSFQESLSEAGRTYFEMMVRTKICVAPRGTAHETLRVYEGLMLGCVVITDKLPKHFFYQNSPIIEISDWANLPYEIERLLADPERLHALHEASLQFWQKTLSEDALARRCAKFLNLQILEQGELGGCCDTTVGRSSQNRTC